jgi:uncharacterized protein (DUF488 family)
VRAPDPPVIYTVGHSTRTFAELLAILTSAGIRELVDIRIAPGSRRNPQFSMDALAQSLEANAIRYRHEKALGGFRRPDPASPNSGWEQPAFRGYADHMDSEEFLAALDRLTAGARERATAIMCAEAAWWRCHRRLIADALLIRGWRVEHVGLGTRPVLHELTPFAQVGSHHRLSYPPLQPSLPLR